MSNYVRKVEWFGPPKGMEIFTPIYPIAGEYWTGLYRLKLFWDVNRMDERPAFADEAYTKDGLEAATDNSFKKRKEDISRQ
jgi:hypothetical protein